MSNIDLLVLFGTLGAIVIYGVWKTRGSKNIEGYLLGGNTMKWGTIGLSVMATQASAITFLSTPGQATEEGLGYVQIYFGQPLALIIIAAVFIPIYIWKNVLILRQECWEHPFFWFKEGSRQDLPFTLRQLYYRP